MMHSHSIANDSIRAVHSVSDLCAKTRDILEQNFSNIWVAAEIASISTPASGHWYLSLKDDKSQLRCVMFRGSNIRCSKPKIGDEVLVSGKFSLYEARGDLQLILNHLEPRGAGALHQQFELLKSKLLAEGLFAAEHKKPIPKYPERIALVTSATGAALEDIFTLLRRHNYGGLVKVFPSVVQGADAPPQLIAALQEADEQGQWDLILLSRGGGSYEDLFCFNNEDLARTIFNLKTPIVSAIGHEIDTTISDFVADLRCATPTAAAEQIIAGHIQLKSELNNLETRLKLALAQELKSQSQNLANLRAKLRGPEHRLQNYQQHLDRLSENSTNHIRTKIQTQLHRLVLSKKTLDAQSPERKLATAEARFAEVKQNLLRLGPENVNDSQRRFVELCRHLEVVSPMATICRGYSVLQDVESEVIREVAQVAIGDKISAKLSDGILNLEVLDSNKS